MSCRRAILCRGRNRSVSLPLRHRCGSELASSEHPCSPGTGARTVVAVKGSLRRATNWRAVDGCAPFRPGGHRDGRVPAGRTATVTDGTQALPGLRTDYGGGVSACASPTTEIHLTESMPLSAGSKLGPYEILTPLGEGGMGQVWKARDTRLNRFVAIKTSHKRFSERFEREAQAIAALNHPNICSLYDVGPDYLVMEYVEGKPLEGPVPLDQALLLAGQILDALDAAHRKGITHRDLKPGNIMLGPNGVKVLDFGLAKMEHAPSPAGVTQT